MNNSRDKIIRPQRGKQEEFINCSADIAIYGGSAGGGKSYGILLDSMRYAETQNYSAVYFRKHSKDHRMSGGLWNESHRIYLPIGGKPNIARLEWSFQSGANIHFVHIERDEDVYEFQGMQACGMYFDELTHFSWQTFSYLISRNRSVCGVKPYVRATCNPSKDHWLRHFLDWYIGDDGFAIPERSGVWRYFVRKGDEIIWGDTAEELYRHFTPKEIKMGAKPKSFTFIAANLSDNQVLCRNDPNYYSNLLSLNPIEKAQLLDGNWDASYSDLGEIINRRDFTRYDLNYLMTIPAYFIESYFVIDSASKITTYADYSVIMFIAKDRNHKIYIIDIVRKKLEEPDLEQEIIDIYNYWKSKKTGQQPVFQIKGINIEDKSSGISMIQRLQRRNMPIYKLKPHKDKFLRLNDGLGLIKNGVVCVPEHAQWADKFFEECENFRANMKHVVMRGERLPHDDQVDTLAYAISTQVNCMPSVTAYTPLHIREKIKNKQKNTLRNKLYGFD